jgi:hypothetical protein
MTTIGLLRSLTLSAVLCFAATVQAEQIITNGDFTQGLTGWTTANQAGSDGTFAVQTGASSPLIGTPVPLPPTSPNAAMTDSQGPGTHVLYQDFVITAPVASATLSFSYYLGNTAGSYFVPNPASLDFSAAAFNQQARVDVLLASSSLYTTAAIDILFNALQTNPGDAISNSYNSRSAQLASILNANLNTPLRLRFAEVDNVAPFQFGVDAVSLETSAIPEPSSLGLAAVAVVGVWLAKYRRRRSA